MAATYDASAKDAIAANKPADVRVVAGDFRKKVLTYIDGVLGSTDGMAEVRCGLLAYTSSQATFDDLKKMICVLRAQQGLDAFGKAIPPKIAKLDGPALAKTLDALAALRAKCADAVPFALTIIAKRLDRPWELMLLATIPAGTTAAAKVLAGPFAMAVSMVLDQIEERRLLLLYALRNNRPTRAKEIVTEIYKIEDEVREQVDLSGSPLGKRLEAVMASVQATLATEISTIPTDHRHLMHILESPKLRPRRARGGWVWHLLKTCWKALPGVLAVAGTANDRKRSR